MKASTGSTSSYFSNENFDFKPFSDDELAIIMGGGDDELTAGFSPTAALAADDSFDE